MKRLKIVLFVLAFALPAFAEESKAPSPEPTVVLTRAELQALISAAGAQAIAGPAMKKVQEAFAPPPNPAASPSN